MVWNVATQNGPGQGACWAGFSTGSAREYPWTMNTNERPPVYSGEILLTDGKTKPAAERTVTSFAPLLAKMG
jgi:hypothetical protein